MPQDAHDAHDLHDAHLCHTIHTCPHPSYHHRSCPHPYHDGAPIIIGHACLAWGPHCPTLGTCPGLTHLVRSGSPPPGAAADHAAPGPAWPLRSPQPTVPEGTVLFHHRFIFLSYHDAVPSMPHRRRSPLTIQGWHDGAPFAAYFSAMAVSLGMP